MKSWWNRWLLFLGGTNLASDPSDITTRKQSRINPKSTNGGVGEIRKKEDLPPSWLRNMLLSNPKLTITFISHQKKFFAFTDFFISQIPVVSNRSPALPNWVCWTKALHTMRITTKFSKTLRWSGAVGKKVGGVGCQFFSAWMGWKKNQISAPKQLGVGSF